MNANVCINAYRKGVLVDRRVGHNVWVDGGRTYLANLIAFTSPVQLTTEGTVDLIASFPTITTEYLIVRHGYEGQWVEHRVVLSSPSNAASLLSQINAQVTDMTASLGGSNGLIITPDFPTTVELVSGTAFPLLGLLPEFVAPAGMTTTPIEDRRVKYMGFGIGSNRQTHPAASAAPLSTSYPPGDDPNATAGNEYNREMPTSPPIRSLERPVRITGSSNDYSTAPGTDVWLVEDPNFINYIILPGTMRFHAVVDTSAGDMLYAPFTEMPLSEVGLFLGDASINDPFNVDKLVAYYSFGTLMITTDIKLEMIWAVTF